MRCCRGPSKAFYQPVDMNGVQRWAERVHCLTWCGSRHIVRADKGFHDGAVVRVPDPVLVREDPNTYEGALFKS
jgi:hypothetical protein